MKTSNKKIYLLSLGCAKNLVDSEILIGGLKKSHFAITETAEEADIIIINTCGFLDQAREESVDSIIEAAEFKKTGKLKTLVVMGCLAERYPGQLKKELPEVDRFFGVNDHRQIVSFLTGKPFVKDDPLFWRSLLTPNHYAYLKIAEGCDNGCSFCSIPLMRGKQISRPISALAEEANRLVTNGVKEPMTCPKFKNPEDFHSRCSFCIKRTYGLKQKCDMVNSFCPECECWRQDHPSIGVVIQTRKKNV